jgi:hypothetical protein
MNLTKILTIVLLTISLVLGWYLYSGVQKVIDDRAIIESTESAIIERLKLIREAEVLYQEQNGKYTAGWDTLAYFIDHGRVPIIQRREEIKQKPYGGEEVIMHVDTLGFVSARERIFKKNYSMAAADDGIFDGYNVKVGDEVIKNQKAYTIYVGDRKNSPPFVEKGIIQSLADVKPGQTVKKGTNLINYSDYVFNKNTDVTKIGEVPNNPGVMFDIFVKKIDRNGLMVDVIEVKDPKPINPGRRESNDQKTRKPLRFGSRTDVATAGNWE